MLWQNEIWKQQGVQMLNSHLVLVITSLCSFYQNYIRTFFARCSIKSRRIHLIFTKIQANGAGQNGLEVKTVDIFNFWDHKGKVEDLTFLDPKPKPKPKLLWSHEAEAKAVTFWNHETEPEALASKASALWTHVWIKVSNQWNIEHRFLVIYNSRKVSEEICTYLSSGVLAKYSRSIRPSIRFLMMTGLGKKRAFNCSVTWKHVRQEWSPLLNVHRFLVIPSIIVRCGCESGVEPHDQWPSVSKKF